MRWAGSHAAAGLPRQLSDLTLDLDYLDGRHWYPQAALAVLAVLADYMDRIDARHGRHSIHFGGMWGRQEAAPTWISCTQIPTIEKFH